MVANSYVPERGDIVKLEFVTARVTASLIQRVLALNTSGMSLEEIAETINVELETLGREQQGYRPVLVISPLKYNRMSSIVLACPITSKRKGLNFEVALEENITTKGVVLTDQIKALDWRQRRAIFVEKVTPKIIEEVQAKIKPLIL